MNPYIKKDTKIYCPLCGESFLHLTVDVSEDDHIQASHVAVNSAMAHLVDNPKEHSKIRCMFCGTNFLSIKRRVRDSNEEAVFCNPVRGFAFPELAEDKPSIPADQFVQKYQKELDEFFKHHIFDNRKAIKEAKGDDLAFETSLIPSPEIDFEQDKEVLWSTFRNLVDHLARSCKSPVWVGEQKHPSEKNNSKSLGFAEYSVKLLAETSKKQVEVVNLNCGLLADQPNRNGTVYPKNVVEDAFKNIERPVHVAKPRKLKVTWKEFTERYDSKPAISAEDLPRRAINAEARRLNILRLQEYKRAAENRGDRDAAHYYESLLKEL